MELHACSSDYDLPEIFNRWNSPNIGLNLLRELQACQIAITRVLFLLTQK